MFSFMFRFDIIYLTDQFDPSLVIMKRRFCWDHGDIFYKSMEVYSKSHHLTPAEEEKLLSPDMNLGDKLLYEAFNNSWWKQPEVKDPDFWEEVGLVTIPILLVTLLSCYSVIKSFYIATN